MSRMMCQKDIREGKRNEEREMKEKKKTRKKNLKNKQTKDPYSSVLV
jgi:hypothetical protein